MAHTTNLKHKKNAFTLTWMLLVTMMLLLMVNGLNAQDAPPPEATEEIAPESTAEPMPQGEESEGRLFMTVEEITIEAEAETNTLLITLTGTNINGCTLPPEVVTDINENALFVDFEPAEGEMPSDIQCIAGQIPFTVEVSVPVDQLDLRGKDEMFVVSGDFVARIPISRVETNVGAIPVVTFGEPERYLRIDVEILAAQFERASDGEGFVIAYVGNVDGCEAPVLEHLTRPEDDPTVSYRLEVFRPLSLGVTCPMNVVRIEGRVPLPGEAEGILRIAVNEFSFIADPAQQAPAPGIDPNTIIDGEAASVIDQALSIGSVDVLVTDGETLNVKLQISGELPDGCPPNIESDVEVDGTTITVTVTRMLDTAMMCPMVISSYDETIDLGQLAPDVYTLILNGTEIPLDLSR